MLRRETPRPSRLRRAAGLLGALVVVGSLAAATTAFVRETLPPTVARDTAPAVDDAWLAAVLAAEPALPQGVQAVPVLNFHDVSHRRGTYSVTPERFAQLLAALQRLGFRSVRLSQVLDLVEGRDAHLPPRPVLLTFDDGIASEYVDADAVLQRYGFDAVTFVPTASLAAHLPSYYLTPGLLHDLVTTGRWEVGSHTDAGHRFVPTGPAAAGPWLTNLVTRPDGGRESLEEFRARVDADLARSLDRLAGDLRGSPRALAYPFSASDYPTNDARTGPPLARVVADRFALAFTADLQPTTAIGPTSDRYRLPRYEVTSTATVPSVLAALRLMLPRGPGTDVAGWALEARGGTCDVAADGTLRVGGGRYVHCVPRANPERWTDYRLRVRLSGLTARTTGMVDVRDRGDVRAEVSVSDTRLVVRVGDGTGWAVPVDVRLPGRPRGSRVVEATVRGAGLVVRVDDGTPRAVPLGTALPGLPGAGLVTSDAGAVVRVQVLQAGPIGTSIGDGTTWTEPGRPVRTGEGGQ